MSASTSFRPDSLTETLLRQNFESLVAFLLLGQSPTWVLKAGVKTDASVSDSKSIFYLESYKLPGIKNKTRRSKKDFLGAGSYGEVYAHRKKEKGRYVKKEYVNNSVQLLPRKFLEKMETELKAVLLEFIIFSKTYPEFAFFYRLAVDAGHNKYFTRMTMPFLGRQNAQYYLRSDLPKMPVHQWFRYFGQICQTLFKLHHELKVAHLDVKPLNMLMLRNSRRAYDFKLIDFGAALCEGEFEANGQREKTTGWYRPVEAFMGSESSKNPQNHGYWTDVYSVGASFLQLIDLDLEEIFNICSGDDPDWDDVTEVLENFLADDFVERFLKPAKISEEMIKNLTDLMRSMMAFGSKERFSYLYLGRLSEFFLEFSEVLKAGPEAIAKAEFPADLKAEVARSVSYLVDSDCEDLFSLSDSDETTGPAQSPEMPEGSPESKRSRVAEPSPTAFACVWGSVSGAGAPGREPPEAEESGALGSSLP